MSVRQLSPDHQRRVLARIGRNLASLDHAVGNLQDLAAIDRSQFSIVVEPFGFNAMIARVVASVAPALDGGHLECALASTDWVVLDGDVQRLERAFATLLACALRRATRVTLTTSLRPTSLVVSLIDNGSPLEPDDVAALFVRPERAAARSALLHVARKIIEAHDGTLNARPCPGGMHWSCRLPLPA